MNITLYGNSGSHVPGAETSLPSSRVPAGRDQNGQPTGPDQRIPQLVRDALVSDGLPTVATLAPAVAPRAPAVAPRAPAVATLAPAVATLAPAAAPRAPTARPATPPHAIRQAPGAPPPVASRQRALEAQQAFNERSEQRGASDALETEMMGLLRRMREGTLVHTEAQRDELEKLLFTDLLNARSSTDLSQYDLIKARLETLEAQIEVTRLTRQAQLTLQQHQQALEQTRRALQRRVSYSVGEAQQSRQTLVRVTQAYQRSVLNRISCLEMLTAVPAIQAQLGIQRAQLQGALTPAQIQRISNAVNALFPQVRAAFRALFALQLPPPPPPAPVRAPLPDVDVEAENTSPTGSPVRKRRRKETGDDDCRSPQPQLPRSPFSPDNHNRSRRTLLR